MRFFDRSDRQPDRQPEQSSGGYRGGCAEHSMHGPVRSNTKDAHKDVYGHGQRMHGSKTFPGGYIEGT